MTAVDIAVLAGGDIGLAVAAAATFDLTGAFVIAADSGVELAAALGLTVDVAVGDFDSLDAGVLARLERSGSTDIRRHPADKDATDLALALDAALVVAPDVGARVAVVGVEGGRADFAFANHLVVAADRYRPLERHIALDGAHARVVTDVARVHAAAGTLLSVVPLHGPAVVTFTGVRWPLAEATLESGTTWALSNESTGGTAELTVHTGTALLFALTRSATDETA